jgi:hypothetical protein
MYSSPQKLRAARAYYAFSILFFVVFIAAGYVLAAQNGRGSGFGDGYTVQSCHTPGGPYYVKHLPKEVQQCPNPTSSQLKYPGQNLVGNPEKLLGRG